MQLCTQVSNLRETEVAKQCLQVGSILSSQLGCHFGDGLLENFALWINVWPPALVVVILSCDIEWYVSRFGQSAPVKPQESENGFLSESQLVFG